MKIARILGNLRDLHTNSAPGLERDRHGEIAERAIAVGNAKTGDVEDRITLEGAPRAFVEKRVEKLNLFGHRHDLLEERLEEVAIERCRVVSKQELLKTIGRDAKAAREHFLNIETALQATRLSRRAARRADAQCPFERASNGRNTHVAQLDRSPRPGCRYGKSPNRWDDLLWRWTEANRWTLGNHAVSD